MGKIIGKSLKRVKRCARHYLMPNTMPPQMLGMATIRGMTNGREKNVC